MEPVQFLDAVSGYRRTADESSADKPIRLARIDPAYDPFTGTYPDDVPPARVTFEGESTLSGKTYPVASGFIPSPDARVWMVPIGTTYMIAGGAASYTNQGFYAYEDGSSVGVEFGAGNYWDDVSGLNLDTDADIGGDVSVGNFLTIGPRAQRVPEMRWGSGSVPVTAGGTSGSVVVNFSPAFPVGSTVFCLAEVKGQPGGTAQLYTRSSCTTTAITLLVTRSDAAAGFTNTTTISVHWIAWAAPSN
jgi:hypothetical protein